MCGFGLVARFQDDQRTLDTGCPGARDDLVQICREGLVSEMAVAVDHRRRSVHIQIVADDDRALVRTPNLREVLLV